MWNKVKATLCVALVILSVVALAIAAYIVGIILGLVAVGCIIHALITSPDEEPTEVG